MKRGAALRAGRRALVGALLVVTWVLSVYHAAVFPKPEARGEPRALVEWIPREGAGPHHLILAGGPMGRGLEAGTATAGLIYRQESVLREGLEKIIPSKLVRRGFMLFLMRWFWGIAPYFDGDWLREMWGVSESTSHEFDDDADRFTRQVAYHGLHEVGQSFVDFGSDMGCTVFAVPFQGSWLVARNFDFEGGRIFDEEKIVKWVFPDRGSAFVSVIWAGMVGAVTGVNEHGVFLAINAAGSTDFRRYGTPSTLVLLEALQGAKSAEEAVAILEKGEMFITDIFIVGDAKKVFRVEKSPRKTRVLPIEDATVVANHLVHPDWAGDKVNELRKTGLTSAAREASGKRLLEALAKDSPRSDTAMEERLLSFLRDRHAPDGTRLHLGNRGAIDALIAAHGIIYNARTGTLYVSRGPSVSGPFIGLDLKASFASRKPVETQRLPADPEVTPERYAAVKESLRLVGLAEKRLKKGDCAGGKGLLDEAGRLFDASYSYYMALGNWDACENRDGKESWRKALELRPAYRRDVEYLEGKLR